MKRIGRAGVTLCACALVASMGCATASAQPLLPKPAPSASAEGNSSGSFAQDETLSKALTSAMIDSGSMGVLGLSGNYEGKAAQVGDKHFVNPAYSTLMLSIGALSTDNNLSFTSSDPDKLSDTALEALKGEGKDSELASDVNLGSAISTLQRAGISATPGKDEPGFSMTTMLRTLDKLKASDGQGKNKSNNILPPSHAQNIIGSMRDASNKSVLKNKIDGGDVASVTKEKDGKQYEVGYVFNKDTLLAYTLLLNKSETKDIPGALGRVLSDALKGAVADVSPDGTHKNNGSTAALKGRGKAVQDTSAGHGSAARGQSAFE